MKCFKVYSIVLVLVGVGFDCFSQSKEVVTQDAEWFQINSAMKFHKRFGLFSDGQFRYSDFQNAQYLARTGLEIFINKNLSIVPVGYAYIWNYQYGEQPVTYPADEQRLWEHIMYKHKAGKLSFNHRLRLEQRFIEKFSTNQSGDVINEGFENYRNRIRYRILFWSPFKGDTIVPESWFWGAWNEVFISWGDGVTYNKPDQNRTQIALGYQVNKDFQIILGPYYQYLIKSNGTQQENNVGFNMWFNYNFDFSKESGN
ncbi:MAG: DUF2490 domain-containing protein [Flammeovirgaceae bacterium]|nr:DUF2490 domain-containing protein [Flammeovirgaceae bacterium]